MNISDLPKNLIDKVNKAKENVYSWSEIDELIKKENVLARQLNLGKISDEECTKKLSSIQTKVPSLIINSIPELDMVMRYIGVPDDVKRESLTDLELKAKHAEDYGFLTRFSVWFYKSVSGRLTMYCGVQIKTGKV